MAQVGGGKSIDHQRRPHPVCITYRGWICFCAVNTKTRANREKPRVLMTSMVWILCHIDNLRGMWLKNARLSGNWPAVCLGLGQEHVSSKQHASKIQMEMDEPATALNSQWMRLKEVDSTDPIIHSLGAQSRRHRHCSSAMLRSHSFSKTPASYTDCGRASLKYTF